jgi:hypothetical protein
MNQTLLALGALLIITTIAMNQQRSILLLQRTAHVREMEAAAKDYAKFRMSQLTSFAFDEARLGMTTLNTDTGDLTDSGSFGVEAGETAGSPGTFDDIDDFHGYVDSTVTHTLSNETYRLRATYEVQYIDPSNPSTVPGTSFKSTVKRMIITIESRETLDEGSLRIVEELPIMISDYV